MPDLRGEISSQESVFEDREKEFYIGTGGSLTHVF